MASKEAPLGFINWNVIDECEYQESGHEIAQITSK